MPAPGRVEAIITHLRSLWIQIQQGCKYCDQPDIATLLSTESTAFRTDTSKMLGRL